MTEDQRDARAREDARARDSATRDVKGDVDGDEEVVDAEVVDDLSYTSEESGGNGAADQVERDLDELSATKRERDEYLALAQRTRADFENYRKRVAKETSDALARGKAELARDLLPVIDNLERALQSGVDARARDSATRSEESRESLVRGVELVLDEIRGKLASAGVEAFDPTGERFDPELHEALSAQPAEGTDSGVVLETVEKGYRLNGQILRPARVVVSK
ncbi:MAG TPA: nucleotide exchange factor GrpE [Solirubrobacterales bacterium]